jgi:23S rRNA (pseudouridine1915-N3)-methyltransferase
LNFKNKKINFLIGDTDGVSSDIKEKSDLILSLSPLTFPHELARLILIEQIYRAISISNNSPYHRS